MLKRFFSAASRGAMGFVLLAGLTRAAEPVWSTGKIDVADPAKISHPAASKFLSILADFSRNKADAVRVSAAHDAKDKGYGKCIATVPVDGTTDKMHAYFSPFVGPHNGPEKFFETHFIDFRNGSHWTHVDLEQRFVGSQGVRPKKAILSNGQHAAGISYGLFSGVDLFPHTLRLWKHKISLYDYLQGRNQTLFELATIIRGGRSYLVFRTGGTAEEVIVDPEKNFALIEHSYIKESMTLITKVVAHQEISPGVWIPKKAEHTHGLAGKEPTVITLDVLEYSILPMKELEQSLHFSFPPGWTITDERIGKTFTVEEPPTNNDEK